MRLIICNRAPASPVDGWIHIVPKGELPNSAAGIVQVLDDTALDSILANIEKDKNRFGDNWPGVYAGREHFIYDAGQDSAALAWFKEFQKRPNGIWARDNGLTTMGADALKNRFYKYTSFVADPSDLQPVPGRGVHAASTLPATSASGRATRQDAANVSPSPRFAESAEQNGERAGERCLPHYRVMKIETIGFTNHANGKELLTPITNRNFTGDCITSRLSESLFARPDSSGSANQTQTQHHKQKMNSVCTLLGLSADADESAVHTAVSRLLNRGDISTDALATLKADHKSLGQQNETLLREQSEALLDACAVKDEKIRNRLADAMKLLKNREERLGYLADFGYLPGSQPQENRVAIRVLNRGAGVSTARHTVSSTSSDNEQETAIKIQNRASELQGKGLKYDSAWNQARREVLGHK